MVVPISDVYMEGEIVIYGISMFWAWHMEYMFWIRQGSSKWHPMLPLVGGTIELSQLSTT